MENLPQSQDSKQSQTSSLTTTRISSEESWTAISKIELPADCSLADVRKYQTPALSGLVKTIDGVPDKTECYKFLKMMIVAINQFFGANWSDYQLKEVAKEFYSMYYYWTQLDMKNFMHRCRALYWGKVYGTYAPATLMEWAAAYDDEWVNTSVAQTLNDHARHKKDSDREQDVYRGEQLADQQAQQRDIHNQMQKMKHALEVKDKQIEKLKNE